MHVRGKSSQTKIMKRVSFSLTSVQGSVSEPVRMEALTTEKICTTLEPVEISLEKYPHPRACAAIAKEPVIDPCRYERWLTLVRVATYVLRGVQAFESKGSSDSKELSVEKLQDAKIYWYRQIQWEVYQAEYERLKENLLLSNTSAILELDPYYAREIGCYR